MKVPWAMPYIDERELREVNDAISENWLSMGKRVGKLETLWAEHVRSGYAVAVSNGTLALELALRVMGIGPGHEVIVPAMTYIATVNSVVLRGATPVFADIEDQTFNLNPGDIEHRITDKTRAIIYIDYGGNPADTVGIMEIGEKHHIPVLQDAAQSLGGKINGKPLGFQTNISTASFHVAKLVTTIEGGMIFTDEEQVASQLRILRNQGEDPEQKYHHVMIGYNARMTDLQAAIGLVQFRKFESIVTRRAELANRYNQLLGSQKMIDLPPPCSVGNRNAWFFYPVLVPNRDEVAKHLRMKGVDTRIAYPMPVYRQSAYREFIQQIEHLDCPISEEFTGRVLNLPLFHQMTDEQQVYVVDRLISTVEEVT